MVMRRAQVTSRDGLWRRRGAVVASLPRVMARRRGLRRRESDNKERMVPLGTIGACIRSGRVEVYESIFPRIMIKIMIEKRMMMMMMVVVMTTATTTMMMMMIKTMTMMMIMMYVKMI